MMKDMVLVDLYTDGNDAASQANQALENGEFHTIAIPFYVIYDPDKKVVATFPSLTRDPAKYLAFLNTNAPETVEAASYQRLTVQDPGWRRVRFGAALGQSGGGQLLGHLVRALPQGDSELQPDEQGTRTQGSRGDWRVARR